MDPDHNRWAITPPDREARPFSWALAVGDGESDPPRDQPARQSSGIALASRIKVLVAHVVAQRLTCHPGVI